MNDFQETTCLKWEVYTRLLTSVTIKKSDNMNILISHTNVNLDNTIFISEILTNDQQSSVSIKYQQINGNTITPVIKYSRIQLEQISTRGNQQPRNIRL